MDGLRPELGAIAVAPQAVMNKVPRSTPRRWCFSMCAPA